MVELVYGGSDINWATSSSLDGDTYFSTRIFYGKAKHPRICQSFPAPAPAPSPSPSTALASAPATASALSGGQGRLN